MSNSKCTMARHCGSFGFRQHSRGTSLQKGRFQTRLPQRSELFSDESRKPESGSTHGLALSSGASGSTVFRFDLMFFPAAYFLSGEEFNMISAVARVIIGIWGVNLLPHPPLPKKDRRTAVVTLLHISSPVAAEKKATI